MPTTTAQKIVARFLSAKTTYEHKIVGKDARLLWGASHGWTRPTWRIDELPQKGKKKLKTWYLSLELQNSGHWFGTNTIFFSQDEVVRESGIGPSDDYASMVRKLEKTIKERGDELKKAVGELTSGDVETYKKHADAWESLLNYYPREEDVFYLEVAPEGTDPFTVNGKDFTLNVAWTEFKVYSPDSDLQSHDPYYTYYSAKSPTGARKLYLTLKADPNALKNMPWSELNGWLAKNKIPVKYNHSSWH